MHLENIVIDARDPARLGAFWEAALGTSRLTDEADLFETRLPLGDDGAFLDLCFPRVADADAGGLRLHLDLLGGRDRGDLVRRLVDLGAAPADIGQGDVPWTVLADPEGTPFCVVEGADAPDGTGPVAELPLDSADPERDGDLWAWLSGWVPAPGQAPRTLQHPSGRGPRLGLWPEPAAKGSAKNRIHLDIRLDEGDDADDVVAEVVRRGGRALDPGWGELPWRVLADTSGNELCLLPAPASPRARRP